MSDLDHEEHFHAKDRKQFRKERRRITESDRSKFKKTDLSKQRSSGPIPDLPRGRVVAITGEGLWVDVEGARCLCSLKGAFKKENLLVKNLVAVGDFVRIEGDAVAYVEERTSTLSRTEIRGQKEQLIAANVDQLLVLL